MHLPVRLWIRCRNRKYIFKLPKANCFSSSLDKAYCSDPYFSSPSICRNVSRIQLNCAEDIYQAWNKNNMLPCFRFGGGNLLESCNVDRSCRTSLVHLICHGLLASSRQIYNN
jgi:hypothetical protein